MNISENRVVIVGAGLAGLRCAISLAEAGLAVTLLEAADAPGGRVRTDEVEGFRLDRGFQLLLTAYPEAAAILDYDALDLHPFYAGALIRASNGFHVVADPRHDPAGGARTIGAPVGSMIDKARVAQMQIRLHRASLDEIWSHPETTTLNYLRRAGYSMSIIDGFFRPFFAGVFLEPDLRTSSRMFEFLFKMFAAGQSAVPATGMEAIPRQMVARLPEGTLRLNARVSSVEPDGVRLEDGEVIDADIVVVATDGDAAASLLPEVASPGHFGKATLYYAADRPPVREAILVLDTERSGPVNDLVVISNASPLYAPPGAALIAASTVGVPDVDDARLDEMAREQLISWWGEEVRGWQLLRIYRIPDALPRAEPPALSTPRRPVQVRDRLFVCGDHRDNGSINGALASGRRTAEAILEGLSSG